MMPTQARISISKPLFAWLLETSPRYRSCSGYLATPALIPVELARFAARHTSIDMLYRVERTEARLQRRHTVITHFPRQPNSPLKYPPTKEQKYLDCLPTSLFITTFPGAPMTTTSAMATRVRRIQKSIIRMVSRVCHHLRIFRQYLFPPHVHLTACICSI